MKMEKNHCIKTYILLCIINKDAFKVHKYLLTSFTAQRAFTRTSPEVDTIAAADNGPAKKCMAA
jgi:hypothetical protein